MTSASAKSVDSAESVIAARRWDLYQAGISVPFSLLGSIGGSQLFGQIGAALGPLIGLALVTWLQVRSLRKTPTSVRAQIELDDRVDHFPLRWVMIMGFSTWLAAEITSFLVGFGIGFGSAYVSSLASVSQPEALTIEALVLAGPYVTAAAVVVTLPVVIFVGRAIGVRENNHPYRWAVLGVIVGQLLSVASTAAVNSLYDLSFEFFGEVGIRFTVFLVLAGAGLVGARWGAKRYEEHQAAAVYSLLPDDRRVAALDRLREELFESTGDDQESNLVAGEIERPSGPSMRTEPGEDPESPAASRE